MPLPSEVKAEMEAWNDPTVAVASSRGTTGDVDRAWTFVPGAVVRRRRRVVLGSRAGRGGTSWAPASSKIGELGHAGTFLACDTLVPLVEDFMGSVGAD